VRALSGVVVTLAALAPMPAAAQLVPDAPRLQGPHGPDGLGLHWVRSGALPDDGDAVLVTWNAPGLPEGVSLRGGAGTGAGGDAAGFGGVDLRAGLADHRPGLPVDLAWSAGAGVGVGSYVLLSVPVGVSAGRAWSSGAAWVAPYVAAGLSMDLRLGGDAPEEEFEVQPSVELGVDLALDRARRVVLRVAASLGDRQAVAVGAVIRPGG
jgi:hypothetical protein